MKNGGFKPEVQIRLLMHQSDFTSYNFSKSQICHVAGTLKKGRNEGVYDMKITMKTGESPISSVQISEALLRYSLKCLKVKKQRIMMIYQFNMLKSVNQLHLFR
jgi:hypothetical protein